MGCSCQSPAPQMVVYDPRYFQPQAPAQFVQPVPVQDDRALMPMPGGMPGQGGLLPMPGGMPGQGGLLPMPGGMPGQGGMLPMPGGMPGQGGMLPMPGGMPGQGGLLPMPGGMPGQGGMLPMPGGMPGQGGLLPMPGGMPGQGGMLPMPGGMPGFPGLPGQGGGIFFPQGGVPGQGGGILPVPGGTPGQGGMPGQGGGGVPAQLSQANLPSVLAQFPRPVGQPPAEMLFLFNYLRGNPQMLQTFIRQRPQSLQQAVQFAQFGTMGPREDEDRVLPGFCYNRWSLIFTFNNVFLMFPVANLFGFVIGHCFPQQPCIIPDFTILFAFC
ncbi:hypothetical protein [Paenibacillus kobensis]|uniref:hypothetical protein n=1 Tax=Paenibacillus kobensis TaxID=59841 RepID=UPI000FD6F5B5|nr:hypothetical protein [Paenibacillus kobensis]